MYIFLLTSGQGHNNSQSVFNSKTIKYTSDKIYPNCVIRMHQTTFLKAGPSNVNNNNNHHPNYNHNDNLLFILIGNYNLRHHQTWQTKVPTLKVHLKKRH